MSPSTMEHCVVGLVDKHLPSLTQIAELLLSPDGCSQDTTYNCIQKQLTYD